MFRTTIKVEKVLLKELELWKRYVRLYVLRVFDEFKMIERKDGETGALCMLTLWLRLQYVWAVTTLDTYYEDGEALVVSKSIMWIQTA